MKRSCIGLLILTTAFLVIASGQTSKRLPKRGYEIPPGAPGVPTLVTPANLAVDVIPGYTFRWRLTANTTSYRLQISTVNNFATVAVDQSQADTAYAPPLSNGVTYYWHVRSSGPGGTSAYSTTWSFTTLPNPPLAPTLALPANGATGVSTSPTFTWNASGGAVSYRIQVSLVNTFASTVINQSVGTTSYPASGLANLTTYYWRVNATNLGGTSGWSSIWSFTTATAQAPDTTFKIVLYAQLWIFGTYGTSWDGMMATLPATQVDWRGIDYVILFSNGNIASSYPYFTIDGAGGYDDNNDGISDSLDFWGYGQPGGNRAGVVRDSVHAFGGKVLVTIQAVWANNLNAIANDSVKSQVFADEVTRFCVRNNFDGTDLDWEETNGDPLPSATIVGRFCRILGRSLHASGKTFVLPSGMGDYDLYAGARSYIDLVVPQYYAWGMVYNSCLGGQPSGWNGTWFMDAMQRAPAVCPSGDWAGYGLRDSVQATASGNPGPKMWVSHGWPKNQLGAGLATYGNVYHTVSDTVVGAGGWGYYAGSATVYLNRMRKVMPSNKFRYDATHEAGYYTGTAASTLSFATGWPATNANIPAGERYFVSAPTNINAAKWTSWLRTNGFKAIMLYGLTEDFQPDSTNGHGRFGLLETVKRTLGRIP